MYREIVLKEHDFRQRDVDTRSTRNTVNKTETKNEESSDSDIGLIVTHALSVGDVSYLRELGCRLRRYMPYMQRQRSV